MLKIKNSLNALMLNIYGKKSCIIKIIAIPSTQDIEMIQNYIWTSKLQRSYLIVSLRLFELKDFK